MKTACRNHRKYFLIPLVLFLGVIYAVLCSVRTSELQEWVNSFFLLLAAVSAVEMAAFVYLFKEKNGLAAAFMILTILFHFSHILLIVTGFDFGSTITNVPFVRFGEEAARKAFDISIRFQYANFLGFCFYDFILLERLEKPLHKIQFANLREVTYGLFAAGLAAWCGYALKVFLSTRMEGYGKLASTGTDSYLVLAGRLFLSALILLIYDDRADKKKRIRKLETGCAIAVYFVSMLSGQRGYSLICICILIYLFVCSDTGKRKVRNLLLLGILAFMGIIFLNMIRITRESGMSLQLLSDSISSVVSSPVSLLINEFAISENVVAKICAQADGFNYGLQFLTSFIIVVPGISYMVPVDFTSLSMAGKLDMWNLGGTFIGDYYFDFGECGIFFALLYGIFLNGFFNKFQQHIRNRNYVMLSVLAPVLCDLMMSIRSTTYKIPRNTVFVMIMYAGIVFVITVLSSLVRGVEMEKQQNR